MFDRTWLARKGKQPARKLSLKASTCLGDVREKGKKDEGEAQCDGVGCGWWLNDAMMRAAPMAAARRVSRWTADLLSKALTLFSPLFSHFLLMMFAICQCAQMMTSPLFGWLVAFIRCMMSPLRKRIPEAVSSSIFTTSTQLSMTDTRERHSWRMASDGSEQSELSGHAQQMLCARERASVTDKYSPSATSFTPSKKSSMRSPMRTALRLRSGSNSNASGC